MNREALKSIMDSYCAASGLMVSVQESSIFFSPNTKVDNKVQICLILDIITKALNDKYLDLPANVSVDKTKCFQLIDRIMSEHGLFIDCLPYEWWSGTSDGLFLPIYPP